MLWFSGPISLMWTRKFCKMKRAEVGHSELRIQYWSKQKLKLVHKDQKKQVWHTWHSHVSWSSGKTQLESFVKMRKQLMVKESLRSVIINIFFSHSYNLSDIKEKNCGPGRYQHQMEDKVLHSSSLLTRVTTGCNQNIVNYPQLFPITIHIFKMDLKCHPQ